MRQKSEDGDFLENTPLETVRRAVRGMLFDGVIGLLKVDEAYAWWDITRLLPTPVVGVLLRSCRWLIVGAVTIRAALPEKSLTPHRNDRACWLRFRRELYQRVPRRRCRYNYPTRAYSSLCRIFELVPFNSCGTSLDVRTAAKRWSVATSPKASWPTQA